MNREDTLRVTVRLHSTLRHRDGQIVNLVVLELPQRGKVADVLHILQVPEKLDLVMALNGQVVGADADLKDGDQLQLIPALSGGSQLAS